jgi:putative ABC transport system permease protein
MTLVPILTLAARSLLNRRATVTLTMIAVALSVALFAGVETIRHAARASFERTISGADLVVGARSGPVNLMLYAVFHIGDATNNITWESYEEIAGREEVAWTVPLSLGDSHHGFRVVGTTTDFFAHYRYGDERALAFAAGAPFADVFDAVIGAEVARDLGYRTGDEIVVGHGLGAVSFSEHKDKPFRVAGILAPSGTPVDRSVLVSLEGIEAIHVGWEGGARNPRAAAISADAVRGLDLRPTQITAFIVGLNSPIAVLRLQREINEYPEEPLLAVIPGVALSQLWQVVGVVERTLASISLFVVLVGLVGILTSILTSLNERRREMAILRAIGARPWHVFALLIAEAGLIAFTGALLGLGVLHLGLALAAPWAASRYGLALIDVGPSALDAEVLGGVTAAALVLGAWPAWRAFRTALADGLAIRT